MGIVEWIELATLVVLLLAVIPVYRWLGVYTSFLRDHQKKINSQADTLESNRKQLESNARELKALHEGIAALAASFAAIRTALEPED